MGQTHSVAMTDVPAQRRSGRTPTPAQPWPGAETVALTAAGRASLEQELRRLRDERLPDLIAQLVEARDDPATRKEDAEILMVQHEQQRVQRRVGELEWLLTVARAVAPPVDGVIALGSTVEIEDEGERDRFQLVDPHEADAAAGRISTVSPMGQALLGRRAGDGVVVDVPAGQRSVRVVAVS